MVERAGFSPADVYNDAPRVEPPHCQQVARSLAVDAVPVSSAERWFNNGAYVSQFNRA